MILHEAHRELETLCLTKQASRFKTLVAQEYADLIYNGLWFSAFHQDLFAFVSSNLNHLAASWRATDVSAFEEVLGETRDGVERVRRVVSDLLRLARRTEGPEGPVDLRRVVETILPIVRPESRWRARVTTRLEPVPEGRELDGEPLVVPRHGDRRLALDQLMIADQRRAGPFEFGPGLE